MTPEIKLRGFYLHLNTYRMNIRCRTLFDCTCTGITGQFRAAQVPYRDATGRLINNLTEWNKARNKHRNWETLLQMISLRAQPTIIATPKFVDGVWQFEFSVETPGVYSNSSDLDNLDALLQECSGIPMVTGLDETVNIEPNLVIAGPSQNLWFETINI